MYDEIMKALSRVELKLEVMFVETQLRLDGKTPTASDVIKIALDNLDDRHTPTAGS